VSAGAALAGGVLLGLAASVHCVGVCLPAMFRWWCRGRTGRLGLGAPSLPSLPGAWAAMLPLREWRWPRAWRPTPARAHAARGGVDAASLAVAVILYGCRSSALTAAFCSRVAAWEPARRAPWLFGLLVGLSPCPPLLLACASLVELGPALAALAFGIWLRRGTTAPSSPSACSAFGRSRRAQRACAGGRGAGGCLVPRARCIASAVRWWKECAAR